MSQADHIRGLEAKCRAQARQLTIMREAAEDRNAMLDASGVIVNCTGCFRGGPKGWELLTHAEIEARVVHAEDIAKRLRTWWTNIQWRLKDGGEA